MKMLRLSSRTGLRKRTRLTSSSLFYHSIAGKLLNLYSRFIGEETYSKGDSRDYLIDNEPTWCVDPLDGTVNYIHLFPMFCVSIGFIVDGKPVIGAIYAPFLNQLFSSCAGCGAWLNEKQQLPLVRNSIPPMPVNAPSGCVFSCEWGKDRRDRPDSNMHRKVESFVNMAAEIGSRDGRGGMVHGMRSLGRSVNSNDLANNTNYLLVQPSTWLTWPWDRSIYGGRVDVGNGISLCAVHSLPLTILGT
jgi:hypothetical protein